MRLDGQIVLCDHSDSTFPRNYDGLLSHLSIYDNALNYSQVLALFHQVCGFLCQTHVQTLGMLSHLQTEAEGCAHAYLHQADKISKTHLQQP